MPFGLKRLHSSERSGGVKGEEEEKSIQDLVDKTHIQATTKNNAGAVEV